MNFQNILLVKKLIRMSGLYRKTFNSILKAEADDEVGLIKRSEIIKSAIKEVPFYMENYSDINLSSEEIWTDINVIRKSDIAGKESDFISNRYNPKFLIKKTTGGTTGTSLNLFSTIKSVIWETVFIDSIFAQIGAPEKLRIAILRGNKPTKGIYEYRNGCLILSSYDLNLESVKIYIDLIKKFKINCLHVYPTSLHIFIKLIKELGKINEIPDIKGVVSSSEILSIDDKKMIMSVFPKAKLIDIYGQNEHVALGYSIDLGFYKFLPMYSFVEFIETGKEIQNNKIFEIIGTNYSNSAMPLIRYGTDDYVEIDSNGKIVSIIGRSQDFLINKDKELVPCMVIFRAQSKKNIINFQYFQDKEGELEWRVIVNNNFNIEDEKSILIDMEKKFSSKMNVKVVKVDEIEKTPTGKQKRLIQLLDISKY